MVYLRALFSIYLLCFSALSVANHADNQPPLIQDFKANYNIIHEGDIVGSAVRSLTNLPEKQIEFSYKTDIEWFIFDDQRYEKTIVTLKDKTVVPFSYRSSRKGTGKDKFYHWQFDPVKNTVTNLLKKNPKAKYIKWPEALQSKLSFHLQSRVNLINNKNNFTFNVLTNSGKIKQYHYQYVGEEELMLPYGIVETVKLKRQKPNSKKVTYVWFAPSLNYLMVKLYQIESDFKQISAELVNVDMPTLTNLESAEPNLE